MTSYFYLIQGTNDPHSVQAVQVGSRTLQISFQWAIVSEEQFSLITRYLKEKAESDPLYIQGVIVRDYDWYSYYSSLYDKNVEDWIEEGNPIPYALQGKTLAEKVYIINTRIEEAHTLDALISQYKELLVWQATVSCEGEETTVAKVIPGGWYRNGDNAYAFRFKSPLSYIGKEDLGKVYIEFEVYDE